jgi:PEGA domain
VIRRLAPLSIAVASALLAPSVRAVEPPTDAATSRMRDQFHEGVKAYDAKEHARALDDFRAAYAAKPSPIIKQNIALCLRALGRNVEAVDTLQSMLVEGGSTLKPKVRDLAAKAIAEMLAVIATVKVVVNEQLGAGASKVAADVYVDDALLAMDERDEPLRLDAGSHRFRAHAEGFIDAVKDVVLSAGQRDIVVALDLVPAVAVQPHGGLRVKVANPDAKIAIDAGAPQPMGAPLDLAPGAHRISVTADGYLAYVADVTVVANEIVDVDVALQPFVPERPPAFEPTPRERAKTRRLYLLGGVAIQGEALTLSPVLDEGAGGGRRQFAGAGAIFEIGRTSKYIDIGALVEVGVLTVHAYQSPNDTIQAARVNVLDWVLAPELRLHSAGRFHVLGGAALGIEGSSLGATLGESDGSQKQVSGSGIGLMGLIEAGVGYDFVRTTLEATAFTDVHDVRGVKEEGQRLLFDSPAVRGGVRLAVGYRF